MGLTIFRSQLHRQYCTVCSQVTGKLLVELPYPLESRKAKPVLEDRLECFLSRDNLSKRYVVIGEFYGCGSRFAK